MLWKEGKSPSTNQQLKPKNTSSELITAGNTNRVWESKSHLGNVSWNSVVKPGDLQPPVGEWQPYLALSCALTNPKPHPQLAKPVEYNSARRLAN